MASSSQGPAMTQARFRFGMLITRPTMAPVSRTVRRAPGQGLPLLPYPTAPGDCSLFLHAPYICPEQSGQFADKGRERMPSTAAVGRSPGSAGGCADVGGAAVCS
jgi:hypothetical protein